MNERKEGREENIKKSEKKLEIQAMYIQSLHGGKP